MRVVKCRKIGGEVRLGRQVLEEAHDIIASGGLVVYPTETLYGLGADPFSEEAVNRIFKVKRRPRDLPISMAVPSPEAVWFYGVFDESMKRFCQKHLPGPVTVLLRATSLAPSTLLFKGRLIGLRVPDHPIARQLLRVFAPLTATSANLHNRPAPGTCQEAIKQLGEKVDMYIDAGASPYGQESTIVDLSGGETRIIRSGALSEEDI